jgi:hypothetical protein
VNSKKKIGTSFLNNIGGNLAMSKNILFGGSLATILLITLIPNISFADEQISETTIIPLDTTTAIEKTTIQMNIPQGNTLSWGFVEGKVVNHVPNHPVIIQIYDNNDKQVSGNNVGAVHFAQTQLGPNGEYEYKFRVADYQDNELVNIFEGDYSVKIFKVVYLQNLA